MRNIETFPSKQMYLKLSLAERKEAEFYYNIDRRHYLAWLKWLNFITFSRQLLVSLRDFWSDIHWIRRSCRRWSRNTRNTSSTSTLPWTTRVLSRLHGLPTIACWCLSWNISGDILNPNFQVWRRGCRSKVLFLQGRAWTLLPRTGFDPTFHVMVIIVSVIID